MPYHTAYSDQSNASDAGPRPNNEGEITIYYYLIGVLLGVCAFVVLAIITLILAKRKEQQRRKKTVKYRKILFISLSILYLCLLLGRKTVKQLLMLRRKTVKQLFLIWVREVVIQMSLIKVNKA